MRTSEYFDTQCLLSFRMVFSDKNALSFLSHLRLDLPQSHHFRERIHVLSLAGSYHCILEKPLSHLRMQFDAVLLREVLQLLHCEAIQQTLHTVMLCIRRSDHSADTLEGQRMLRSIAGRMDYVRVLEGQLSSTRPCPIVP